MSKIQAKLAFLHAAHEFACTPSAVNFRTLTTAMQIHQSAIETAADKMTRVISEAVARPARLTDALVAIQQLEAERLAGI